MDLALNNLQGLICHKTQPTNPTMDQIKLLVSVKYYQLLLSVYKQMSAGSCKNCNQQTTRSQIVYPIQILLIPIK